MAKPINHIPNTIILPRDCTERVLPLSHPQLAGLRNAGVLSAGSSQLCPPYRIGRPHPAHHVLLFTLAGEGQLVTPETTGTFTPGEAAFLPSALPYMYSVESAWTVLWFHLLPDNYGHAGTEVLQKAMDPATMSHMFEACFAEMQQPRACEQVLDGLAKTLAAGIAHCLRDLTNTPEQPGDPRFHRLVRQMRRLPNSRWTVDDMAREMCVSAVQCHRIIHNETGSTPKQLSDRMRIDHATILLQQTDYTLDAIAAMTGYDNAFSFSRAFKRITGHSPSTMRLKDRAPA